MVHNKQMIKSLNAPIARSIAKDDNTYSNISLEDKQLEKIVLLCNGEKVMLTFNIGFQSDLLMIPLEKL